MGKINFSVRTFLSIILIGLIIFFVFLYSVDLSVRDTKNDSNSASDGGIIDSLNLLTEEQWNSLYETAIFECQSKEEIDFSGINNRNIVIKCDEIRGSGKEGFKTLFNSKIEEAVEDTISDKINFEFDFGLLKMIIKWNIILIFILTAAIILLARTKSFMNLGIVAVISGAPFLLLSFVESFIKKSVENTSMSLSFLPNITRLNGKIGDLLFNMHSIYLAIFLSGIVLIIAGIAVVLLHKLKKLDEGKEKKKGEKKEK